MSPLEHAAERYRTALRVLATGAGTIQERLDDASRYAIVGAVTPFTTGPGSDVPPELLGRLHDIEARVTAEPNGGGGRIAATIVVLDDHLAVELARDIFDLALELQWALESRTGR